MAENLLGDLRKWFWPVRQDAESLGAPNPEPTEAAADCAFVVDDEVAICAIIAQRLATSGLAVEQFHNAPDAVAGLDRHNPAIIFLDVALQGSDAIDVLRALGDRHYAGTVQVMSGSNSSLLDDVCKIGARHGLNMLAPMNKPFRGEAIQQALSSAGLGRKATANVDSSVRKSPSKLDLSEAFDKGWLELWYQPKIDLHTKTFAGAEGLIRARHPVHDVMSPVSFLPGATQEQMRKLTEHVVLTALRDWDEFAALGVPMHAAVNTTIGALLNPQLPALIREHRPKSDQWPGLILELTESEVMQDVPLLHEVATQLRIYDVTFSIDDFGEGYSSFARLREVPFSELKLDQSFVKNCAADRDNAAICQAVIDLAHHFGSIAVAEGLENAADLQAIHRMGCDLGQGFLLGRPMPKKDLLALLRQPHAARRAS